jgi:hypothetical protein
VEQLSLFAPDYEESGATGKPSGDQSVRMTVLITVKAAPNPSERYGETVCVAGIRLDLEHSGWVRLYPINFRELESESRFKKYDIVTVEARPSPADSRAESWRPRMDTLTTQGNLGSWKRRRPYIVDHVSDSMCGLLAAVRDNPPARSLAAIRPQRVLGLDIEPHPGWTRDEQAKIDNYVSQLELPGMGRAPKTALEAPRFKGWYKYRCASVLCKGHRQGIYDWEWVALQRHLADRDDASAMRELRTRFLDQICSPQNDLMFYVGNQAKHQQSFMVLGAYYPRR